MIVHLIDGTYELFRHFYGLRRAKQAVDPPLGAALGVLRTVVQMLEGGATHIGVATDHVIESFRNALYDGYKTGEGIEPALHAQFHPLEEMLASMGVAVWPMVELEADDGLASAAHLAALDPRVEKVSISDARQGSRAVRRRRPRRAGGPTQRPGAQRGRHQDQVRRRPGAHPGLSRARRRHGGRLSWHRWHRDEDGGEPRQSLRDHRGVSA